MYFDVDCDYLNILGWFYHAPEPSRRNEAMGVPLASQIPGLNDLSSIPYDDAPKPLFKDSGKFQMLFGA